MSPCLMSLGLKPMLAGGDPTGGGHGLLCYKSFLSQGALMMEEDPGAGGNSIGGTVLGGLPK